MRVLEQFYTPRAMTVEELLEAPEGEHYEFKEAQRSYNFEKLLRYSCALANS